MTGARAIETRYAGCRFRSRLESRWAVFFDVLGIRWEYEPQGYLVQDHEGRTFPYLPDFCLPDLGTWIEVKGSSADLNRPLIEAAAVSLPDPAPGLGGYRPRLMLLGQPPEPAPHEWAWIGLRPESDPEHDLPPYAADDWWGFTADEPHGGLRHCDETSTATPWRWDDGTVELLTPMPDTLLRSTTSHAYRAARSARFEHGEAA